MRGGRILGRMAAVGPLAADRYVGSVGKGHVPDDLDQVPERRVALVLGTGKWAPSGRENLFYRRRLEAASELYHAGKVERLLLSGDNSRVGYDEPSDMMTDLVQLGVPPEHMVCDYAGFRTLDSVIRAGEVFGLDGFTVVSQAFHCQRAVVDVKLLHRAPKFLGDQVAVP